LHFTLCTILRKKEYTTTICNCQLSGCVRLSFLQADSILSFKYIFNRKNQKKLFILIFFLNGNVSWRSKLIQGGGILITITQTMNVE
jgi:hypothetical protein